MSRFATFLPSLALLALLAGCAPAPTPAPTSTAMPTSTPTPSATETPQAQAARSVFAPQKRSVWETTVGPDQLRGDCPKGSIVPPYGPVLITPRDDGGFDWKDVQNGVYAFTPAGDAFTYSGPNVRKDGALTMTLTFKDEKTFAMQAEYVRTDAPACTHAYEYVGVFKFER
jgi:hypothetical protein